MYYGDAGYAERIERLFRLTEYAEEVVRSSPELELMAPRSSVTLCFRHRGFKTPDLDAFNLKLREEMARRGRCLINYARVENQLAIRLVAAHPDLTREDLDVFFQKLLSTAESLAPGDA